MITFYDGKGHATTYDTSYCSCCIEHWQDAPDKYCIVCRRDTYDEMMRKIESGEIKPCA